MQIGFVFGDDYVGVVWLFGGRLWLVLVLLIEFVLGVAYCMFGLVVCIELLF